uniref:Beta-1,4-N-acetylgalactosaminyltransferase n=1 Tax=Meloidogyne hapla TaxID=6305 RepID=A0A1I8B2H5_MELHA
MSSNYSLHRYRVAYHSLNNPNNSTHFGNYFASIYLHFHVLERKWRSFLFVSILSILFIFFYLTLSSFNNTTFISSNLTIIVSDLEEIISTTTRTTISTERLSKIKSYEEEQQTLNSSRLMELPPINNTPSNSGLPLCPNPPPFLVGPIPTWMDGPKMDKIEQLYSNKINIGGHGMPKECTSGHKVAIIVPYRDREQHLRIFLHNMHSILQKQQIDYGIFIIEQVTGQTFNRGKLMNVGFVEANRYYDWQCFIFHDVDLIPEDDRNLYNCPQQPRHMSVAVDKFNYRLPYYSLFGGAGALTKKQMTKTNGFSNDYWGWGGEDDDFSARISYAGYTISRYPSTIAKYKMIKHVKEASNPINLCRHILMKKTKFRWNKDGLINLNYKIISTKFNLLYTNITVDLLEEESRRNLTLQHLGEGC